MLSNVTTWDFLLVGFFYVIGLPFQVKYKNSLYVGQRFLFIPSLPSIAIV